MSKADTLNKLQLADSRIKIYWPLPPLAVRGILGTYVDESEPTHFQVGQSWVIMCLPNTSSNVGFNFSRHDLGAPSGTGSSSSNFNIPLFSFPHNLSLLFAFHGAWWKCYLSCITHWTAAFFKPAMLFSPVSSKVNCSSSSGPFTCLL